MANEPTHVSERLKSPGSLPGSDRGDSSLSNASSAEQGLLDDFWPRMIGIYGNAWTTKYGSVADLTTAEAWLTALREISDYDAEPPHPLIRTGIRACNLMNRTFPPNPGEFLAIVEENRARPEHRPLGRHQRLEHLRSSDETAAEGVSMLRRIAGLEPPQEPSDDHPVP